MATKHYIGKGKIWPLYAAVAAYAMSTSATPALSGFYHLELVFVYKPQYLLNLAFLPIEQVTTSLKDNHQLLKEKAKFIAGMLLVQNLEHDRTLIASMY